MRFIMKNLITILLAIAFSTSVAFASAASDKDAKSKDAKEEVKSEVPAAAEEAK